MRRLRHLPTLPTLAWPRATFVRSAVPQRLRLRLRFLVSSAAMSRLSRQSAPADQGALGEHRHSAIRHGLDLAAMRTIGPDAAVPPRGRWWRARRPRPRVRLGDGVRIGRDVRLRADPGSLLIVGDGVALGDGARVLARGGVLRIGAGAVLAEHASLADTV